MSMTYQQLVAAAKRQIREIQPQELESRLGEVTVLDVREADEFDQGSIEGSIHLARGLLEGSVRSHVPDIDQQVVLYCAVGARSALAALSLQQLGYTEVFSLAGGFGRWKAEGYPWGTPKGLTTDQRGRYSRHTLLPEVGEAGQIKLLESKVVVIGAGGLGSPAAPFFAGAGGG